MNDISESEQRLSAALERIDYGIDRLQAATRAAEKQAAFSPAPAAISEDMADLQRRQTAALDRAQQRLAAAGAEAARLASANDRLMEANRVFLSGNQGRDAALHALEAEIEALRAARSAEIAQMGDILAALEAMLGIPETAPLPPSHPAEDAFLDISAEFSADVEALPIEGRVLRFERDSQDLASEDDANEAREGDTTHAITAPDTDEKG